MIKRGYQSQSGQNTIILIFPLIILSGIAILITYFIPELTNIQILLAGCATALLILCFASTTIALYVLIFSMLLSPEFIVGTTGGASLGRGVTLRLDDIVIMIISITWIGKMALKKDLGIFLRTPLNKPIAYYLLACLISTLFGALFRDLELKTGLFFVLKYFEFTLIYFMAANHINNKKQINHLLIALFIVAVIVSIIGITQIPSGARVSAPFEGKEGEPNTFGGYLLFMICLAGGLALSSGDLKKQIILGLTIVLMTIPLIYTQSRSSYLGTIPALISFIWLSERRYPVFIMIFIMLFLITFFGAEPARKRISYTFFEKRDRGEYEVLGKRLDTSASARLKSWTLALRDFKNHPLFGYGVTGYRFIDAQYFRVMIETGAVGLFFFFHLLWNIFKHSLRVFKTCSDYPEKGLTMGFIAGFIGLLFHAIGANTFIIVRIMEPFWFVCAMIMSISRLKEETK